ncbi:DUF2982 domain-containing protein [Pseudoalteromonas fenneropenaei]|uniref:DUF2982 domain-containing protein n=1 Tax=Pseudoalteromonas fenneropenaei TaxID=1737459 RepID=A0ABV7CLM0_9GAMM
MTSPQHKGAVMLRATANRFSIECMLVGAVAVIVVMVFVSLRPTPISILEIAIVSAGLVAIWLGFLKSQEPYFSMSLDTHCLTYQHKFGAWQLPRTNLHSAGVPKVTFDYTELELNAVGIKINNIDEFLIALSPRLAAKLLIEQRHILLQAVKMYCKNGNCPEDWLIEDSEFKSPSGKQYHGLIAMFGNRMAHLRLATEFDLMLPANVLDRDIWQFANLLNHWKRDPERIMEQLHAQQTLPRSN